MSTADFTAEDLEIVQAIRVMEFQVIDRLSPETRTLINEVGDPGIKKLIIARIPGPVIVEEVELWARSVPITSQPQRAV